jgi:hypothetical protein
MPRVQKMPTFSAAERNEAMRSAFLFCSGILFALVAIAILSHGPNLYSHEDSWLAAAFTRVVGLGLVVQGAAVGLAAAVGLGRAFARDSVGGGPVLPICGLLFLFAAPGPLGQAQHDRETLEVMESMPGSYSDEIVDDVRRSAQTELTFGALWLVVGAALLGTPFFLKASVWQLSRRLNLGGCGIAIAGFMISALGILVWFGNAMAMEGARAEVSLAGHLGVLAGSIVVVVGSISAVVWDRPRA